MNLLRAAALASTMLLAACAQEEESEDLGATTSNVTANVKVEAQVNDLKGPDGQKRVILDRIVEMINATPNDGTILAATYAIDDDKVIAALIAKQKAGATVKLVQSARTKSPASDALAHALNKPDVKGGHEYCNSGGGSGCISSSPKGIMHSKFILFSKTKDAQGTMHSNVVWFGSANLTTNNATKLYNNCFTIFGDNELHDELASKYFDRLWRKDGVAGNDFYKAPTRGYYASSASGTIVHASPSATDLVAARLAQVTPGAGCRLAISQNKIHFDERPEIWTQLTRIAKNCVVKVLVNQVDQASFQKLKAAGIEARWVKTHDKMFLVNAKFDGSAQLQQVAFTGSHNWAHNANYDNDDIIVRTTNGDAGGALAGQWIREWGASEPLAAHVQPAGADADEDDDG